MKVLFVNCCISQRGEKSRTLALCRAFLEECRRLHPDWAFEQEDIRDKTVPAFDVKMLERRDELMARGKFDDPAYAMARRFQGADKIVVGAPFWDLLFPAALRAYIEHISANGLCYHYDEKGSHGDCRADHLVYLTSGGDFEQPQSAPVLYWRQLAGMFGIEHFDYVFAGGVDISPQIEKEQMKTALEKARKLAHDF